MNDFLQTLLIACIPAVVTGIVSYLVAHKNASSQVKIVQEQNEHDIKKLMEQRLLTMAVMKLTLERNLPE